MSLRSKIVLVLSLVVALFVVLDNAAQRVIFSRRFETLEREEAARAVERALTGLRIKCVALEQEARALGRVLAPVGDFDGADPRILALEGVDVSCVCEEDGAVIWHRVVHPDSTGSVVLRGLPNEKLGSAHPLLGVPDPLSGSSEILEQVSGWMTTELGLLAVCSRTLSGDSEQPSGRRLIVGRFLTRASLGELRAAVGLDFDVLAVAEHLPNEQQALLDRLLDSRGPIVETLDDGELRVSALVNGLRQEPEMIVQVPVERTITSLWSRAVGYSLLSALAISILFPFVLLRLLQIIVTGPLSRLTEHAVEIGRSDDLSAKLGMRRVDEIGVLSREFDRMTDELEQSRRSNVENARLAGMSQISAGVMHNVGNVLNSATVSTSLLAQHVERLAVEDLTKLALTVEEKRGRLDEYLVSDPKGMHLPAFLTALAADWDRRKGEALKELGTLAATMEHIMRLIISLQSFDGRVGTVERVALAETLDTALTISREASRQDLELEVVREYEDLPPVLLDRHRLTEILVNLIRNAMQAMEGGPAPHRLTLRVSGAGEDGTCIEVEDTGRGIPEGDLVRIFQQGFTTKPEGQGFGLHVSANTAAEMGASLTARSAGKGAMFALCLPSPSSTGVQPQAALPARRRTDVGARDGRDSVEPPV